MNAYGFKNPETLDPIAYADFVMFTEALHRICQDFEHDQIHTIAGLVTPIEILEYFERIAREYVQSTKIGA